MNRKSWSFRKKRNGLILTIILAVIALIWILPIIAAFFTSFKTPLEVKKFSIHKNLIPQEWTTENYDFVLHYPGVPIFRVLLNSTIVSLSCVVISLVVCSLSAYGFERFQFRYKETLFWSIFTLSAIPNVVSLVSQYSLYSLIGWLDKLPSIIAPNITNVFYIFLIRQFIHDVPYELFESAKIDGASELQIFTRILVPILKPILVMAAIFIFSNVWNDFMWPSIAITTPAHSTITPALRLLNDTTDGMIQRTLAGCIVAMAPTLVIFILFRKQFLKGLQVTGSIKG